MKLMMIDLDGTLFDTRKVNYMAYKDAIEPYGFEMDYQYYCDYCNGRHYLDFLPQITTADSELLHEMHKRKTIAYSSYLEYAKVNWRLVDLVKACRGEYKTALVTTASQKNTYDILGRFGLVEIFDLIVTQEDITRTKPDPEGFLIAIKKFDVHPEDCVIFEDSEVGIEAAEKTGATVFVSRGFN